MRPHCKTELLELQESIDSARTTLRGTRIKDSRHFFLTALAGNLWHAIATADTVLAVLKNGNARGIGPLKRFLHECYLDVLFLSSDPDADFLAAKSLLANYRDSRQLLTDYRQVLRDHASRDLPPVPPSWSYFEQPVEDTIGALDDQNVAYGGAPDLFRRAWESWEQSRRSQWHWSGLSRKKMVDALIERGKLDGESAFIALSLTQIYNAAAHANVPWAELEPTEDGSTEPPPYFFPTQNLQRSQRLRSSFSMVPLATFNDRLPFLMRPNKALQQAPQTR